METLRDALDGLTVITDPQVIKVKSKDFYWYSPVLKPVLDDKLADLVVCPRSEADVIQAARACVAHRVPLTVRGAGTGNYGQAVPLAGGVVLDMSLMKRVVWLRPGMARVEAGLKMVDMDLAARDTGWELRMFPSTKRTATIGGFIAGGSAGVGSITWGVLRDRGNLEAARIVTMEAEPRAIELRGDDVQMVNHAYGTNGIITELEIPLAPAYRWIDSIVAFDDFMAAVRFAQALGEADGIVKKLVTPMPWPLPRYFKRLSPPVPDGAESVFTMVGEPALDAFDGLVREHGGAVCYRRVSEDVSREVPLYEYTWNHTTLHALKVDPAITYLQSLFPAGRNLELIEHMYRHFGEEVMLHCEFVRREGRVTNSALQVVRYTTPERLDAIMDYHEAHGVSIANPHTYYLEDGGGRKFVGGGAIVDLKRRVDPHGLLNPGKLRSWPGGGRL